MDNATAKANQFKTWQTVAPVWKRWNGLMRRLTAPISDRMIAFAEKAGGGKAHLPGVTWLATGRA